MRKKMHNKKWAGLLDKSLSTPAFYKRDFFKTNRCQSERYRDCVNNGFLPNKTTGRSKSIVSHINVVFFFLCFNAAAH